MRRPRLSLGWILALLWGSVLSLIAYMAYNTASTADECIERGYPKYYVSWSLDRYCIRRVNGTEEVVRIR